MNAVAAIKFLQAMIVKIKDHYNNKYIMAINEQENKRAEELERRDVAIRAIKDAACLNIQRSYIKQYVLSDTLKALHSV